MTPRQPDAAHDWLLFWPSALAFAIEHFATDFKRPVEHLAMHAQTMILLRATCRRSPNPFAFWREPNLFLGLPIGVDEDLAPWVVRLSAPKVKTTCALPGWDRELVGDRDCWVTVGAASIH